MNAVAIGVATVWAAIPAFGFVALYLRMPWYRSEVGRGMMIYSVAVVLLVGMAVLRVLFGAHYALREPLAFLVFGVVGTGSWVMFIALLRIIRTRDADNPSA